ncbi:leucyl aminopeptidase family protein [Candidatus Cytomitobacter indipagum]|uniref:Leucyl aminopeptidase family protein n=1 Tax=Candidatus Cytomitobacter indipagum TaxID=2601575 RepID=A0A5C0UCV1_9PROT|nr:leucyl aminopeptidase family protein [Candidatus Cytomitobacter indipagum]QEK37798.1 leucyl aminopeptidase family protein [Candidatus Cytomitobacter indipagum]
MLSVLNLNFKITKERGDALLFSVKKSEDNLIYRNESSIEYFTSKKDYLIIGVEVAKYIKKENKSLSDICIDCSMEKEDFLKFYEGILIGSWEYDNHKTDKSGKNISVNLLINQNMGNDIESKAKEISNLIEASFLTRKLVEMPGNLLTPSKLAEYAKNIDGLKVEVEKINHGGIWEVGKGSSEDPLLLTCEWNGDSSEDPIILVGKGVTFDSGGLSLKPPRSMEDMKCDMGGAATVLGIMQAAVKNKIKKRIIGIMPCVENMPSGNALKPGDVITSMSGKTIEVLNTDAEGRLILADALHIAQNKYNAKEIIDFATLTGAVTVALGELYAGLFSNNNELANKITESGEMVCEPVCRLPLHEKYDELMNSDIADMCNIQKPGGGAGSITAAQFLQRFVNSDVAWAHLDIAGVARTSFNSAININKSTGFGVRLIYNYLTNN